MGTLCNPKVKPTLNDKTPTHQKEIIQIHDMSELKSIKFQFTTEMIIHLQSDLLIIFTGHTTNIKANQHFVKLPMQGGKLQDHANAYLERNKLSDDLKKGDLQFITFNIMIPTLNFSKVSLIFCDPWKQEAKSLVQFQNLMKKYFDSLKEQKINSITVAEFTSQLGFNIEKGVNRIIHEMIKLQQKPKQMKFLCLSQESKAIFMQSVNCKSQDVKKSFVSQSESNQSNYY